MAVSKQTRIDTSSARADLTIGSFDMVRNAAFLVLGLIAGFGLARIVPGAVPAVEVRGVVQLPPAGPSASPEASARGTDYAAIPFEGERRPAPVQERGEPGSSQARPDPDEDGNAGSAWPLEEPSEGAGPAGAPGSTGPEERTGVVRETPPRRNDARRRRSGPRPAGGARGEESEEGEPLPPFDFTESELRLIVELQRKYQERRNERLMPYEERMKAVTTEMGVAAQKLREESLEELKLQLGPERFAAYQAEMESGRMQEAERAIESMDKGFLGITFDWQVNVRGDQPGEPAGVLVTGVVPGSAAYAAGVREDEVIIAVGGSKVEHPRAFRDAVRGTEPGKPLVLDLYDPASKGTRRLSVVLDDAGRKALERLYRGE